MALYACLFIFSNIEMRQPIGANVQWEQISEGIAYREYYLPDPNHVYVTRMERSNLQTSFETSIANGALGNGLESLSGQVERYDGSLAYWDGAWGGTYRVVAAINGGFFDTNTGTLLNGLVQSGWYARRFEDRQTVGGFAWRFDRQALITECVVQPPGKQRVVLLDTNQSIIFDGINVKRGSDQLVLYTPQVGSQTPTAEEDLRGIEILVQIAQPLTPLADSEPIVGTVQSVQNDLGGMSLPFDHIALSATGEKAELMQGKFPPGTSIGVEFEIRHLTQGCRQERSEDLFGVAALIAGGDVFLREGVVAALNDLGAVLRNPRTAVALNDSYVYFIVVDGRDQLRSLGMSMVELGLFAKLRLGASWGVAMDGGGSSTMVVQGQVVNHPNSETVVGAQPEKTPRGVANGLMMVTLLPEKRSSRFNPGEAVSIGLDGDANMRIGPGLNFIPLQIIPAGSVGEVLDHPLNGVHANGHFWWEVAFDDRSGWASEAVLFSTQ